MNRHLKRIFIFLGSLLWLLILFVVGYVIYMQVNYYRIDDNTALEITNPSEEVLQSGVSYKVLTYNIGSEPTITIFPSSWTAAQCLTARLFR